VDIPKAPIGSPTFPLDLTAALSSDRKKLIFSVVNPTEEKQELSPRVTGVKLRGPGKLFQIAPPSLTSANLPGQKPAVDIVEHPQTSFPETQQISMSGSRGRRLNFGLTRPILRMRREREGRCMETTEAVTLNLTGEDLNVLGQVLQTAKAGLQVEIQHTFHRLYRDELRRRLTVIEHLIDCCRVA